MEPWHSLEVSEVAEKLGTNLKNGLTAGEAASRLSKPIREPPHRRPPIKCVLRSNVLTVSAVLLGCSAASFVHGVVPDFVLALSFALLSLLALISLRYASLRWRIPPRWRGSRVKVIRDGIRIKVPPSSIVPGDLVELEQGDRVPGDVRVVEADELEVDERKIFPDRSIVKKTAEKLDPNTPPSQRSNILFHGTFIAKGRCLGIVVATGEGVTFPEEGGGTEEGIWLQTSSEIWSLKISACAFLVGAAAFVASLLLGKGSYQAFLFSSGLVVALLPYMTPELISAIAARAFKTSNERIAFLKSMAKMDDLNELEVICVEREWGITESRYVLEKAFIDGEIISRDEMRKLALEAQGDEGRIGEDLKLLVTATDFALNSHWNQNIPVQILRGESLDEDLLKLRGELELPFDGYLSLLEKVAEYKDEEGTCRSVVMRDPGGRTFTFMAGELEEVMGKSQYLLMFGSQEGLNPERKEVLRAVAAHFEREGLVPIAIAHAQPGEWEGRRYAPERAEVGLTLLGVVGLKNPVRVGTKEAISRCRNAGIKVIMMSDDDPEFAKELARSIGLIPAKAGSLTEEDVSSMSSEQLEEHLAHTSLYILLAPHTKEKVVRRLQREGKVAYMTVKHDSLPAMKAADLGVTSATSGSDLLVEESGVALKDGGFVGVVELREWIRSAFLACISSARWLICCRVGEGLVMLLALGIAALISEEYWAPMSLRQVIWLQLWGLMLPAFGFIRIRKLPIEYVRVERIGLVGVDSALKGATMALTALLGGALTMELSRYDEMLEGRFKATVVTILLISQLIFALRSQFGGGGLGELISNKAFLSLACLSLAAHICGLYLKPITSFLGFAPLGIEWIWISVLCFAPLLPLG